MKNILSKSMILAVVLIAAFWVAGKSNVSAAANKTLAQNDSAETTDLEVNPEAQTTSASSEESNDATYDYVAQPGDSYSKIARKAIQTYGIISNVEISQAEIVAAETFLTQSAGSPFLSKNQAVSIKESDIKAAVDKAKGLSDATKKNWEAYVQFVDFNTDKVGQA